MELMAVVVMVGILAAMAAPSMIRSRRDARAYTDAGQILELVRNARTRATGRGAAQMISFDTTSSRGKYRLFEAVDPNAGTGANRTPRATCTNPTTTAWADSSGNPQTTDRNFLVDGVNLDGNLEVQANISSQITVTSGAPPTAAVTSSAAVCFTPGGRTYLYVGSLTGNGPQFTTSGTVTPFIGSVRVDVFRLLQGQTTMNAANSEGLVRSILMPSSGNARLIVGQPGGMKEIGS